MTVKVNCPRCKQRYALADELAGAKVQCPECSEKFIVRDMPRTASPPVAEPQRPAIPTPTAYPQAQRVVSRPVTAAAETVPAPPVAAVGNCARCGRRIADATSAFCPGCGVSLTGGAEPERHAAAAGRSGGSWRRGVVVAAVVACVLVITLSVFLARGKTASVPPPSGAPPAAPPAAAAVPAAPAVSTVAAVSAAPGPSLAVAPTPVAVAGKGGPANATAKPARAGAAGRPLPPGAKSASKALALTDPVSAEVSQLVTAWLTDVKAGKDTEGYWADPAEEESLLAMTSWQILSVIAVDEGACAVALKVDGATADGVPSRQNWRLLVEKHNDRWKLVSMIE